MKRNEANFGRNDAHYTCIQRVLVLEGLEIRSGLALRRSYSQGTLVEVPAFKYRASLKPSPDVAGIA